MKKLSKQHRFDERKKLETEYGKVWDIIELLNDFNIIGCRSPYRVLVRRKNDGRGGSLDFVHSPRFYFNWVGYGHGQ